MTATPQRHRLFDRDDHAITAAARRVVNNIARPPKENDAS